MKNRALAALLRSVADLGEAANQLYHLISRRPFNLTRNKRPRYSAEAKYRGLNSGRSLNDIIHSVEGRRS